MGGTFNQQSQRAQEEAYQKRKAIRVRSGVGVIYGIGVEVEDPWDGQQSKVSDLSDASGGLGEKWVIVLESGTRFTVEAIAWRVLNYTGDTNDHG